MNELIARLNEPERRRQQYEEATHDGRYSAELRRALELYSKAETFGEGDLVQWKPPLKNRNYPAGGAPGIVVRYLDPPATDESGQSQTLDIDLGFLDGDQSFLVPVLQPPLHPLVRMTDGSMQVIE